MRNILIISIYYNGGDRLPTLARLQRFRPIRVHSRARIINRAVYLLLLVSRFSPIPEYRSQPANIIHLSVYKLYRFFFFFVLN